MATRNIILVTGTPGSGKTTLAKRLAKALHAHHMDMHGELIRLKATQGYDRKRRCYIIDVVELRRLASHTIKSRTDSILFDSHMAQEIRTADLCIVTTCPIDRLAKRLRKRGYSKAKISENVEAEVFDTCKVEALERGHKVLCVDTSKKYSVDALMGAVQRSLRSRMRYQEFP